MPRKKAKDTLDYLGAGECAQVLRELLKRHRDLRGEANEIAESLIDDVSVEVLAEDIAYLVGSIGIEEPVRVSHRLRSALTSDRRRWLSPLRKKRQKQFFMVEPKCVSLKNQLGWNIGE